MKRTDIQPIKTIYAIDWTSSTMEWNARPGVVLTAQGSWVATDGGGNVRPEESRYRDAKALPVLFVVDHTPEDLEKLPEVAADAWAAIQKNRRPVLPENFRISVRPARKVLTTWAEYEPQMLEANAAARQRAEEREARRREHSAAHFRVEQMVGEDLMPKTMAWVGGVQVAQVSWVDLERMLLAVVRR